MQWWSFCTRRHAFLLQLSLDAPRQRPPMDNNTLKKKKKGPPTGITAHLETVQAWHRSRIDREHRLVCASVAVLVWTSFTHFPPLLIVSAFQLSPQEWLYLRAKPRKILIMQPGLACKYVCSHGSVVVWSVFGAVVKPGKHWLYVQQMDVSLIMWPGTLLSPRLPYPH